MINKLKKYHKDFELMDRATMFRISEEFDCFDGKVYSNFYDVLFREATSCGANYSDMNGVYDIFVPRMIALNIDSLYSRPWHFNLFA